jgi:hypothetical protein
MNEATKPADRRRMLQAVAVAVALGLALSAGVAAGAQR